MYKNMLYAVIGCVLAIALLTVAQIWTSVLAWDVFLKIVGTLGIGVVVIGFLMVVKSDLGEHKRLRDENYLD